jgi:pyridoxine 5-phosphate synthase
VLLSRFDILTGAAQTMPTLGVNIDHVATLRQARMVDYPDPVEAALIAQTAGAQGITVHLREDRRHIQDHDLVRLKKAITAPMNLEMAPVDEMVAIALKIKPAQVTFVPEKRKEITTEGGLDVTRRQKNLSAIIDRFHAKKIVVSLFIDPDDRQIDAAKRLGADAIELNTAAYSEAKTISARNGELKKLTHAAAKAESLGMVCHAGHGLTIANVGPVAAIPNLGELNIGHSIVARAVIIGFAAAVSEMQDAINGAT